MFVFVVYGNVKRKKHREKRKENETQTKYDMYIRIQILRYFIYNKSSRLSACRSILLSDIARTLKELRN